MTLPPLHEIQGRAALKGILSNQVTFFASTYKPGRDVTRLRVGPGALAREINVVHSPDGAELMLSGKSYANFPKESRFYQQIRTLVGDGILTSWGDDWKRQKAFVQPIFTRSRVEGYLDQILVEVEEVADRLRRSRGPVDLSEEMTHFTLKVVCHVLFGTDLDAGEAVIREHFPQLNRSVVERATMMLPIPLKMPIPVNRRAVVSRDALFALCDDVIADRRRTPSSGDDLASLLVAARDGEDRLSDKEIREQILIFLLAGHETTSTSLTFALHLLGGHPDIQRKVRDEVKQVLGDGTPTAAQLIHELPYTTAVVKEAMRLYPAAPHTGRRATEDSTLQGFEIPAGSDLVLSVWSLHHRADLWPEPNRFNPDRFLGDAHIDRYAWLPFGAGPRACIGQHFSMLESIAAIALLVRDFEFVAPAGSDDTFPVASGITLYPLEPVRSTVSPH